MHFIVPPQKKKQENASGGGFTPDLSRGAYNAFRPLSRLSWLVLESMNRGQMFWEVLLETRCRSGEGTRGEF